ncbi:hypothetical protein Goklo_017151 [Gossypium klotzschianum]|uniref:Transmembrane protein n=1 Tax=Gossypium klotzschianum TaxID=34286 RepID=A0A7J8UH61_9ROSI|nr:hypothetical protein [Gossypium klotzschianum]
MTEISRSRSPRFLLSFACVSLHFISGLLLRSLILIIFLKNFYVFRIVLSNYSASCFNLFQNSGFSDDSKGSNNSSKTKSNAINNTGTKVIFIVLGLVAVGLFSFFLFKLWQKKKRDEQYARLLKLFEEDDELEVELGLRD